MSEEKQVKESVKKETEKPKSQKVTKVVSEKFNLDNYRILKYPLSTEKSLRLMESENKLVFVVDKKSNKKEIKSAIEEIFKAKVLKVNTLITRQGKKKAYVQFSMETPAIDIATNMGLM
jgi:ribosomal protein uL23